jgi:radical SAM-linked protein
MRTFARSFLRAGIPLRHTEGFNPHPYLSIAHPLPVGFSSTCEILDCEILSDDIADIGERLNASLPGGFRVLELYSPETPVSDIKFAEYIMTYCYDGTMPADAAERLNSFFSSPEISVEKKSKNGPVTINLADFFSSAVFTRISEHEISGRVILIIKEAPINPRYFTQAIREDDLRPDFSRYKRTGYFDGKMKAFY